jgi:hypothetical protein
MFTNRAIRALAVVAAGLALASAGAGLVSAQPAGTDWTSDTKVQCIQQNWPSIKAKYDPLLGQAGPADRQAIQSLLGPDGKLVDQPSADQIKEAAGTIPPAAMDTVFAGFC